MLLIKKKYAYFTTIMNQHKPNDKKCFFMQQKPCHVTQCHVIMPPDGWLQWRVTSRRHFLSLIVPKALHLLVLFMQRCCTVAVTNREFVDVAGLEDLSIRWTEWNWLRASSMAVDGERHLSLCASRRQLIRCHPNLPFAFYRQQMFNKSNWQNHRNISQTRTQSQRSNLQCFGAVGWASERTSGLQKNPAPIYSQKFIFRHLADAGVQCDSGKIVRLNNNTLFQSVVYCN